MKLTVVISQGQSSNPVKRKLEEDIVSALLFERGVEVTVIPNLYDLKPDGTGMLCLQGISGNILVLSWLYPRAARWVLDRNGVLGREGNSLLVQEIDEDEEDDSEFDESKQRVADARPTSGRSIYCIDLKVRSEVEPYLEEIRRIRDEASVKTVSLLDWVSGSPTSAQTERLLNPTNNTSGVTSDGRLNGTHDSAGSAATGASGATGGLPASAAASDNEQLPSAGLVHRITEAGARRWYPVIDYSRCTNCMECIDFCLFGVYGVDRAETILVEQPDNCRKGCPACSRVCPENAIIFPQHKTPAIAGSPEGGAAALKIDLSKLFGAPDALEVAVLERDVELVAVGRDAVGMAVGIPKRQTGSSRGPKDELDNLIDELDKLDL